MEKETIHLEKKCVEITANEVMLDGSTFTDVSMRNIRITDANLSNLYIEGAQLGGARFENIGMPPVDHPTHNTELRQRALTFESCDFQKSTFANCDLSGVALSNCKITGLTINGVLIEELLAKSPPSKKNS